MQDKSENYSEFSESTERLAQKLGKNLNDLPPLIGISPAMFYAYRNGKYRISEKAWRKLRAAEAAAGLAPPAVVHTSIDLDSATSMSEVVARLRSQAKQLNDLADDLEATGMKTAGGIAPEDAAVMAAAQAELRAFNEAAGHSPAPPRAAASRGRGAA